MADIIPPNCNLDAARINTPLNILTLNVRGLLNRKKRGALFLIFQDNGYDIIALQETHVLKSKIIKEIMNDWPGPLHFSVGTGRGKGLITLFNKKYLESEVTEVSKTERLLISSLKIDGEEISVINVYAPCENSEKCIFFYKLSDVLEKELKEKLQGHVIMLGDFNVTKSSLDVVTGVPHSEAIRFSFNNCINHMSLIDAWRLVHPGEKALTWNRGNCARRLDYIFVSESLVSFIKSSTIKNIGFSDHRTVSLCLEFSSFKFGKGLFKLNASYLKDQSYCKIIIDEINKTKYDYRYLNGHLVWEMIKINVKETSQQYCKFRARESRLLESQAECELSELEDLIILQPHDEVTWSRIAHLKGIIEMNNIKRAEGAQLRSKTLYIEKGEHNTSFFLNLERFRSCSNTITRLTTDSGSSTCDENEILQEIFNKFKFRYNRPPIGYDNVSTLINEYTESVSIPKLSNEEKLQCEGALN